MSPPPRVCAGIITWQDGTALDNAAASVRPYVDELVVLDGLIDGVDPHGLPWFSPYDHLKELTSHVEAGLWRSQSEKRTRTLQLARELGCEWLLVLDADEELVHGEDLPDLLHAGRDAVAVPIFDQDGCSTSVRLLRVSTWKRYVVGAHILETSSGRLLQLPRHQLATAADGRATLTGTLTRPWVEHRPDLRPAGRRAIRLGELASRLDELPPASYVETWHPDLLARIV